MKYYSKSSAIRNFQEMLNAGYMKILVSRASEKLGQLQAEAYPLQGKKIDVLGMWSCLNYTAETNDHGKKC